MRQKSTKETIEITCNECGKTYDSEYISFEMIDDVAMRVYELNKNNVNSHLTYGRKIIDLCSTDCAIKFMAKDSKKFISEITATKSHR